MNDEKFDKFFDAFLEATEKMIITTIIVGALVFGIFSAVITVELITGDMTIDYQSETVQTVEIEN